MWSEKFLARDKSLGYKKLVLDGVTIPTRSANPEKHGFGRAYIKRYYHSRRDKDEKESLKSEEEDRLFVMNLEGPSLSGKSIWVRLPLCR